jgi:tetratricopeptide (TPR) repeat protein
MLIPALQSLGVLLGAQGRSEEALLPLQAAVATAEKLVPIEPDNSRWVIVAGRAHLALAQHGLAFRTSSGTAAHVDKGCAYAAKLQGAARSTTGSLLQHSCLTTRAQLALAEGRPAESAQHALRASELARVNRTNDPVDDRYALAGSLLLVGEAYRAAGNGDGARAAWNRGLDLARSTREHPGDTALRAELLDRIGRKAQAASIRSGLAARGIRNAMLL